MKFIHVSDLHLGKRLYETSLIDDQREILVQILGIIDDEKPTAVLIAGDVYDKSMPSAEAVALFDFFLAELSKRNEKVFVISGNHDSPERIAYGAHAMSAAGIHLSPVYDGAITPVILHDEYGEVAFYMLPFVKPSHVRRFYEEEEINTYTDAVAVAVKEMNVNTGVRNVLITHQLVTGATRSDSEETVGGTDNVDGAVFKDFDYVALGHLHGAQNCGSEKIRYCGTPLKYSFAEANDEKSVTVVTLPAKGEKAQIRTVALTPKRDVKKIKGKFSELITPANRCDDYVQITLTDENDVVNAMSRLQTVYANALELRYDNARTRQNALLTDIECVKNKTPYELFAQFFEERNNSPMTKEQSDYIKSLIEKIEEDE